MKIGRAVIWAEEPIWLVTVSEKFFEKEVASANPLECPTVKAPARPFSMGTEFICDAGVKDGLLDVSLAFCRLTKSLSHSQQMG